MGSSKQQIGKRIHKYLISVKWVNSGCCDLVLLSPRLGFGRAGKHSSLPAQPDPGALRLFKGTYHKQLLLALCFITFTVRCIRGGEAKIDCKGAKILLGELPTAAERTQAPYVKLF